MTDWPRGTPLGPRWRLGDDIHWGVVIPAGDRRAIVGGFSGTMTGFDLEKMVTPTTGTADELTRLAELAAGRRIMSQGSVVPISSTEWTERWEQLRHSRDLPSPTPATTTARIKPVPDGRKSENRPPALSSPPVDYALQSCALELAGGRGRENRFGEVLTSSSRSVFRFHGPLPLASASLPSLTVVGPGRSDPSGDLPPAGEESPGDRDVLGRSDTTPSLAHIRSSHSDASLPHDSPVPGAAWIPRPLFLEIRPRDVCEAVTEVARVASGSSFDLESSSLEDRTLLSAFYDLSTLASTAGGVFTSFGDLPSINNQGNVAFVGNSNSGNGIWTAGLNGQLTNVTAAFTANDDSRTYGRGVAINDLNQIVARDQIGTEFDVRQWDGNHPNQHIDLFKHPAHGDEFAGRPVRLGRTHPHRHE